MLGQHHIAHSLPDTVEACIATAGQLQAQGKLKEADACLDATVARFPDSDMAALRYAWSANHLLDWNAALTRLDALLERFPGNQHAMSGRGAALRELGQLDEAEAALADAISHYPDDFMPRVQRSLRFGTAPKLGSSAGTLARIRGAFS